VNVVAPGRIFLEYFGFPMFVRVLHVSILIHSYISDAVMLAVDCVLNYRALEFDSSAGHYAALYSRASESINTLVTSRLGRSPSDYMLL
jgi:predicted methyltransferase MtxX (methanogen marker protein 4)